MDVQEALHLDYRKSSALIAVQQKAAQLSERAAQHHQRQAELADLIRSSQADLLAYRAAILLEELPASDQHTLQGCIAGYEREARELQDNLAAIEMAQKKLAPLLVQAESDAKFHVAQGLVPVYERATIRLVELLDEALNINDQLHALHLHAQKQALAAAVTDKELLLKVNKPTAWEGLSTPRGEVNHLLQLWRRHVGTVFTELQ